jgi:hypothetical protein
MMERRPRPDNAAVAPSTDFRIEPAELRVATTALPHLRTGRPDADRPLADWDAHFTIAGGKTIEHLPSPPSQKQQSRAVREFAG